MSCEQKVMTYVIKTKWMPDEFLTREADEMVEGTDGGLTLYLRGKKLISIKGEHIQSWYTKEIQSEDDAVDWHPGI